MDKKGLLVISFGTSFKETRIKTIDAIEKDLQDTFPDRIFYHAFSSSFIVRKLRKNGEAIDTAEEALQKMAADGITDILIQPTHLMRAIEYDRLVELFASYQNSFEQFRVGTPLLSSDDDLRTIMEQMPSMYPCLQDPDAMLILMGHGTAHGYNQIYQKLENMLRESNSRIHIGTVEGTPSLEDILDMLRSLHQKPSCVYLAPLLVVAGDHAVNDMASDDPDSWKSQIAALGMKTSCILQGLGEFPEIRELYVQHAKAAIS